MAKKQPQPKPDEKPKKPKTGRNTKRTPTTQEILLEAVKIGHTDAHACELAGISRETFYVWLKTIPDFSDTIKKARLFAQDRNMKIIHNAARRTWTAAAWWLERKCKEEFSVKTIHEHEGTVPIVLSEEAAKRLAKYNPEPGRNNDANARAVAKRSARGTD